MSVSFAMYNQPALLPLWQAWWQAVVPYLKAEGIEHIPNQLCWPEDYLAHWRQPQLLVSQICSLPLIDQLQGQVQYVASPMFSTRLQKGSRYCSLLMVPEKSTTYALTDLRGAKVAINGSDSQSGYGILNHSFMQTGLALEDMVASYAVSGSHAQSLAWLQQGKVDLAAIDCISHHFVTKHQPQLLAGLRSIGKTDDTQGHAWVTSMATSAETIAKLRQGLSKAMAAPELAALQFELGLTGMEVVQDAALIPTAKMQKNTQEQGYDISLRPKLTIP
ncbi:MAG: PhnD/SsuA/transferrin family substrate-binding protein [Gammaproteobacteria bacterium]|nr:PhnD/SsuA/transferrin family substrate-binding protein [Gammaproteobacteria bacterium]